MLPTPATTWPSSLMRHQWAHHLVAHGGEVSVSRVIIVGIILTNEEGNSFPHRWLSAPVISPNWCPQGPHSTSLRSPWALCRCSTRGPCTYVGVLCCGYGGKGAEGFDSVKDIP